jgi:hypothetical protein
MSMQDILEKNCPQSVMLITAHVIQLNVAKAKNQQLSHKCNSHIFCQMYTLQCIFESTYMTIIFFCNTLKYSFCNALPVSATLRSRISCSSDCNFDFGGFHDFFATVALGGPLLI